jgi:pimeloyl-ACP methyl ester carboxylesterase
MENMPVIQTNGIDLYYEECGAGDPLLLIMGITATGEVWEKHVTYWQKYFRCITADNRGVGRSGKPDGPYTTEQMADDYAGLLDAIKIKKVKVVGCSMGSTVAQQLALRHPEKVSSLVLMCPWARCDNAARAIFQHMIDCKKNLSPSQFSLFVQLLIWSKPSWDDDKMFSEMEEARKQSSTELRPQPLHGLEGQAAACMNHNVLSQLPQIQQPVLVIGGIDDIFTPAWMAKEAAAAITNAKLHLYEGAGHAFHWEKIEDFNPRIKNWLTAH